MITLEYYMNELEEWECIELFNVIQFTDRSLWDASRLISYFTCLPYMKSKKKIDEFMSMPWDDDFVEHKYDISDDEITNMKKMAAIMADKLKSED